MTLKKYIEGLQKLAEKYPNAEVVYSIDPEGNAHHPVEYDPVMGHFCENDQEFHHEEHLKKDRKWYKENYKDDVFEINAVCVN